MLVQKAYRYRIYLDAAQEELFRRTIGCCRLVYNLCLGQKILEWERSQPRELTAYDKMKELTVLKAECDFLYEVPNHPLQQAIYDLHRAFANFFAGCARFPTFRRKGQNDSFRYPDPKQFKFEDGHIFLPKAGWMKTVIHRPLEGHGEDNHHLTRRGGMVRVGADRAGDGRSSQPRARGRNRSRKRPGGRPFRREHHPAAAHRPGRPQAAGERAAGRRPAAEGLAQPRESQAQSGPRSSQIRPSQEGRGAQGDHGHCQEPRRRRDRRPAGEGDDEFRVDAASRISRSSFVCTGCGSISDADINAAKNIRRLGISPTGGLPGMACGSSRSAGRKQEEDPREGKTRPLRLRVVTFTTTLSASATPKITFKPTGTAFQLIDAGLTGDVSRTDQHEVTVGLALPRAQPSISTG